MKKFLQASVLSFTVISASASAGVVLSDPTIPDQKSASPTFMLGIAIEFGDTVNKPDVGFTAKVISSNRPNTTVVGGGLSFFPWSKEQVGFDIGVGYNFENINAFAGYDLLRSKPQLSVGYVATDDGLFCSDIEYTELRDGICEPPGGIISDSRLKHDIQLVDVLDNGMKVYSFKYNWSDKQYVGVMAQDLLNDPRWADAVVMRDDGYYAVDYERLNMRMTTMEEWNNSGRYAVARYFIHGDRVIN